MARIKFDAEEAKFKLDMSSMIDIIFQLLIFFMCSIHFKSLEGKLSSHLPKDKGLQSATVLNPNLDEYRIHLAFDESIPRIMTRITIGKQAFNDWGELYQALNRYYLDDRAKNKDTPFKIEAEPKVPFQAVVSTLNACQEAGITNVEFVAATPVNEEIR